jgi:GT2 family glycosyltransferase/peptidoglycan/xylan/chitin deacetylase (PgdA/CDA1 family)
MNGGQPKPLIPAISVIIPSLGRSRFLEPCLNSLDHQTWDDVVAAAGFEILVVVDDAPHADPALLAKLKGRSWRWPVRWIELPVRGGAGAARNRGVREARADHLVFLDDDMVAEPHFLAGHVRAIREHPECAILGAIRTVCHGYRGVYRYMIENSWTQRHERLSHGNAPDFSECFSGNLGIAKPVFERIGGFNESFLRNEDLELGLRLEEAGIPLRYAGDAAATQSFDKSPATTMRDCEFEGRAAAQLWRSFPTARRRMIFAVSAGGPRNSRILRQWLMDHPLPIERLSGLLCWLPTNSATAWLTWFLQDLSRASGVRRELQNDDCWRALSEGTLFLCYHRFCDDELGASEFVIPAKQFRRQLAALKAEGYRFITARDWARAHQRAELVSGRTAVVTIDDGNASVADIAAPILTDLGIPATLFVIHDSVGKDDSLTVEQISTLERAGWEIGSHSNTHPWLTTVSTRVQQAEIAESRTNLGRLLGSTPETFAYPYGDQDDATRRIVETAGYAAALGVDRGWAYLHTPAWNVPRFVIDGRWPFWKFWALVMKGLIRPRLS